MGDTISEKHEPLSDGWFDKNFAYVSDEGPPETLRRLSIAFCREFKITGICDPGYVANVAAIELGLGDGRGHFQEGEPRGHQFDCLAERLASAYSCKVRDAASAREVVVGAYFNRSVDLVAQPAVSPSISR